MLMALFLVVPMEIISLDRHDAWPRRSRWMSRPGRFISSSDTRMPSTTGSRWRQGIARPLTAAVGSVISASIQASAGLVYGRDGGAARVPASSVRSSTAVRVPCLPRCRLLSVSPAAIVRS